MHSFKYLSGALLCLRILSNYRAYIKMGIEESSNPAPRPARSSVHRQFAPPQNVYLYTQDTQQRLPLNNSYRFLNTIL